MSIIAVTSVTQLIPSRGDKLQIIANGTISEDIEAGATVFIQVKYGLITLIKQEADLCDHLGEVRKTRTTLVPLSHFADRSIVPTEEGSHESYERSQYSEAGGTYRNRLRTATMLTSVAPW